MTEFFSLSRRTFSKNSTEGAYEYATKRLVAFHVEVKAILATHESSTARTITLEETYKRLGKLSIKQDDLLKQSLRCVEHSLFRAAHVLSWAALMDFIEAKIADDGFKGLNVVREKWKVGTIEDLRDVGSEFQVIDALRDMNHCSKTDEKALKGLLSRRNECAHPTDYYPGLNETLGYVSEILGRIELLQGRWS